MAGCVSCFILPLLLFLFHRYIQPIILKFWNPWANKDEIMGDATKVEGSLEPKKSTMKYSDVNVTDILKGNCCIRR